MTTRPGLSVAYSNLRRLAVESTGLLGWRLVKVLSPSRLARFEKLRSPGCCAVDMAISAGKRVRVFSSLGFGLLLQTVHLSQSTIRQGKLLVDISAEKPSCFLQIYSCFLQI